MAAKRLFLYLLAITGLAVVQVQAGTSTRQPLIHPVSWFVDGIHRIAPLILATDHHHHHHHGDGDANSLGTLPQSPGKST